jgi:hypothetical protein
VHEVVGEGVVVVDDEYAHSRAPNAMNGHVAHHVRSSTRM